MRLQTRLAAVALCLFEISGLATHAADRSAMKVKPLAVLFLGDKGLHRPSDRYSQLAPVLSGRGIERISRRKLDAGLDKSIAALLPKLSTDPRRTMLGLASWWPRQGPRWVHLPARQRLSCLCRRREVVRCGSRRSRSPTDRSPQRMIRRRLAT